MSYLDVPRLHFFGRFQAAPSTINNTPSNYNPGAVPPEPAWNPDGTHWFKLDCTVRSVVPPQPSPGTDPLVGTPLASVDGHPQIAKLVDLDPEQQMVSMIFGMRVRIGSDTDYVQGSFRPANFVDIFGRVIGGQQDSMFSAAYQSVLEDLEWSATVTSPLLQALRTASPEKLSIRFVVDAFQDVSQDPQTYMPNQDFTWGRVTGTVGPWAAGEPAGFTLGRLLRPYPRASLAGSGNLGYAPFRVDRDRKVVLVDLGNCLPTLSPAGSVPPQMGPLHLVCTPQDGTPPVDLGPIDYSDAAYEDHALVQEFAIPDASLDLVDGAQLRVTQAGAAGLMLPAGRTGTLLAENPTGAYVDATQYVYRMPAFGSAVVELVALQFGRPAPLQVISITANNAPMEGQATPDLPVGVPAQALTFPPQVITGPDGRATFPLTAGDPGNPRRYVDGQVYGVGWSWSQDLYPDTNAFLSVLVFDAFTPPDAPTWENDVKPIFDQYMRLYPFMQERVDLSDYPTVVGLRQQIAGYLSLPITNPSHMPVTRDLSPAKRDFLVSWLNALDPSGAPPSTAGILYGNMPVPPASAPPSSGSTEAPASAQPSASAHPSSAPAGSSAAAPNAPVS